jgi:Ca-activated chloride channel family protein
MQFFANPWALWLLTLVPALTLLCAWAWRWRQRALARLGNLFLLRELTAVRGRLRGLRTLCLLAGIFFALLGVAGPQWGRDWNPEISTGRDLVVVLDLSRSMLAEQPSRQERAKRGLNDLYDRLHKRGGHRVALVVFAGGAKTVFPLTHDYDHFRDAVAALEADHLPPELRPDPERGETSGTRIGAALLSAVQILDPRFEFHRLDGRTETLVRDLEGFDPEPLKYSDILLLSDGDDPGHDDEWAVGADAARKQGISVHVVGIGDTEEAHTITTADGILKQNGELVQTRLEEKPLEEIARRTGGVYVPARTQALPLGKIFEEIVESRGNRTEEAEDAAGLSVFRQRFVWFLAPALFLLAASMLISENRSSRGGWRFFRGTEAILFIPLGLLSISAGPLDPVEDLVRRGNAAFTQEKYQDALKWYELAEERSPDPGLVAFNKAAALYRLERFREAESHYQRCLEDGQIPAFRKARGLYDLGNSLLKQADERDVRLLERAVRSYRAALHQASDDPSLLESARHNLELAKLLLLQAKKNAPPNHDPAHKQEDQAPGNGHKTGGPENHVPDPTLTGDGKRKGGKMLDKSASGQKGQPTKETMPGKGTLPVLPDQDELAPLSPQDVDAYLEQIARRIQRERRDFYRQAAPALGNVKDW